MQIVQTARYSVYSSKPTLESDLHRREKFASIKIDIKPRDETIDMNAMLDNIVEIRHPGIRNWSGVQLIFVAYGIEKLCVSMIVSIEFGIDELEEMLHQRFPNQIQSIDVIEMRDVNETPVEFRPRLIRGWRT